MSNSKRSRHRVPALTAVEGFVDTAYQAEVDQSMARLEARYRKAEKALAAAELKAERTRIHADNLAKKQAEAAEVAANRMANERRLSENIERIREAAKNARVSAARAQLLEQHDRAVAMRNSETARRKAEAKSLRDREELIARSRNQMRLLEREVSERRRELHEIRMLMMPSNYAGRNHRERSARHVSGAS